MAISYPDPSERTTITDTDGNYVFEGLLPGEYPVHVAPVSGYVAQTGEDVDVVANENSAFDLAIQQLALAQIRGQLLTDAGDTIARWKVFADLDEDGMRDDNEPTATSDAQRRLRPIGIVGWRLPDPCRTACRLEHHAGGWGDPLAERHPRRR